MKKIFNSIQNYLLKYDDVLYRIKDFLMLIVLALNAFCGIYFIASSLRSCHGGIASSPDSIGYEGDSAPLSVEGVTVEGDSMAVSEAALFLLDEKGHIYNECECTQNVPMIGDSLRMAPVDEQRIYQVAPALVYAYAPYIEEAKVDSIPWCINWSHDLIVSDAALATADIHKVSLAFHHLMGAVCFLLDGDDATDVTLVGDIPLCGHYNAIEGKNTADHCLKALPILEEPCQILMPRLYKGLKVQYGSGITKVVDLPIEAGKVTVCNLDSKTKEFSYKIEAW